MKKTRFIPYGYTMRNGKTVIEHDEAEIINHIFEEYIKGASLKDLAEELTLRKVAYSEKTDIWDKARISRIIDNSRYTGNDEYDPIIDEDIFEKATAIKALRQRNIIAAECEGIKTIRHRVRCGKCGSPMVRRICSKRTIKESWTCENSECGHRVRISDTDLLQKINLIINRIITNADLMIPKERKKPADSPIVASIQKEIDAELTKEQPSEHYVTDLISSMASQIYKETDAKKQIAARIARQSVALMKPQESFNSKYFSDLVDNIILDDQGRVKVITKTETEIIEGNDAIGSNENT